MKKHTIVEASVSALGVAAYVALIAWIMSSVAKTMDAVDEKVLGPMLFLLLFVVSAAITGLLVFGRPAYLFLSGEKMDAIMLALMTVGSLVMIACIVFVVIVIRFAT